MNSQDDKPIIYLTANDLYDINAQVTGALPFVRDRNMLQYAVRRPRLSLFGEPQFPSVLDKAAALMHSLAYHHLFADGNKRTAIRAVTRFLELNKIQPIWDEGTEYEFVLSVAKGEQTTDSIAEWLFTYSQTEPPKNEDSDYQP
jgi:death-on-curing protein